MRAEDIRIGTSGWKFDDWAGTFYPFRVPKTKWLEYYAARFPVGEINSTYYRIPPRRSFEAISDRTPADFRLFAKVHADVTHARKDVAESMHRLLDSLDPLLKSGKLEGLLAQFPQSFHFSEEHAAYIESVKTLCDGVPLFTEFRHRTWETEPVLSRLAQSGVFWVSVDEPALPELMSRELQASSDHAYIRFHGRNSAAWHEGGGERYNYDYSAEELAEWGERLLNPHTPLRRATIFFNNCYHGQAPRNAQWLMKWLQERMLGETGSDA